MFQPERRVSTRPPDDTISLPLPFLLPPLCLASAAGHFDVPSSLSTLHTSIPCVLVWFASDCTERRGEATRHGVISSLSSSLSLSLSASYFFFLLLPPPPSWSPLFRFFLCSPDHCLERAEARRWRAQEMPSNVRRDVEPCPFPFNSAALHTRFELAFCYFRFFDREWENF